MVQFHFTESVTNTASILDTNNMEIETAFNVSFLRHAENYHFSNCFSNADAETADEWLRSLAFAWN